MKQICSNTSQGQEQEKNKNQTDRILSNVCRHNNGKRIIQNSWVVCFAPSMNDDLNI